MTFDDLFPLLLFIIFIGLPMLNRMQQRGRGGAPPGQGRPGAPGQPRQPPRPPGQGAGGPGAGGASAEREAREREAHAGGQRTTTAQEDDPFAELARRLEEARRRVREAGSPTQAGTGTATSAPARSAPPPARRTIASAGAPPPPAQRPAAQPRPQRPPPPPRDPFPKGRARPPAPWGDDQRRARRPALQEDAQALEVERRLPPVSEAQRRAREKAREQALELISLDTMSVRRGILWHMILGDPVGYRNRRKPSPPASR